MARVLESPRTVSLRPSANRNRQSSRAHDDQPESKRIARRRSNHRLTVFRDYELTLYTTAEKADVTWRSAFDTDRSGVAGASGSCEPDRKWHSIIALTVLGIVRIRKLRHSSLPASRLPIRRRLQIQGECGDAVDTHGVLVDHVDGLVRD
jgi:hypothetical protein